MNRYSSSPAALYRILGSKNMQGFMSAMQERSSPLAWTGPRGITTWRKHDGLEEHNLTITLAGGSFWISQFGQRWPSGIALKFEIILGCFYLCGLFMESRSLNGVYCRAELGSHDNSGPELNHNCQRSGGGQTEIQLQQLDLYWETMNVNVIFTHSNNCYLQ